MITQGIGRRARRTYIRSSLRHQKPYGSEQRSRMRITAWQSSDRRWCEFQRKGEQTYLSSAELYDPSTGRFTATACSFSSATLLASGELLSGYFNYNLLDNDDLEHLDNDDLEHAE